MTAATPPFPEAALRAALTAAVAAWAADDGASAGDEPRRVYVDAFAGAELQFGGGVWREAGEPTRAEAALRALDAACAGPAPRPVALFVEEDPAHLARIYADLEDAAGERLRATRDFASLAPGEASLVEAPFAAVAADVARLAGGARSFVWLAPSSARALPWDALRPLVALPRATLLVRFPHVDFEKQSGHTSPLADLPGFVRRIVEGCSAFLGDAKHAWLPAWRADPGDRLAVVLGRFRALLQSAAGDRVVHPLPLEGEGGARTWLFLVTPEPAVVHALVTGPAVDAPAVPATPAAEPEPEWVTEAEPEGELEVEAEPEREPTSEPSAGPEPAAATKRSRWGRTPARRGRSTAEPARIDPDRVGSEPLPRPAPTGPEHDSETVSPESTSTDAAPGLPEVLDLFPDHAATPAPPRRPRGTAPSAKPTRASKPPTDDGFFADEE